MKDGTGMHFFKDQMYVEQLVPPGGITQKEPIVFIHGQAQTGTVSVAPCPMHVCTSVTFS